MLETKSQSATARLLRLTRDQVHHVMQRAVEFGMSRRSSIQTYNHLSIDEKSVHGREFCSILYTENGIVLDVVGGRRKEDAISLIDKSLTKTQQANVLTISMDMWENFMDAAHERMPRAFICHDKFHLVKYLNAAVDAVRRREVKHFTELKRTRYLFLKDKMTFTDKQHERLECITKANYEVARAWRIKEDFRDIIRSTYTREEAYTIISMWISNARSSDIPEITKVANMFDRHLRGIVNAIHLGYNNGRAERVNGAIQEIKTIGRGYPTVEHFRTAILFFHGGLNLHKYHS